MTKREAERAERQARGESEPHQSGRVLRLQEVRKPRLYVLCMDNVVRANTGHSVCCQVLVEASLITSPSIVQHVKGRTKVAGHCRGDMPESDALLVLFC